MILGTGLFSPLITLFLASVFSVSLQPSPEMEQDCASIKNDIIPKISQMADPVEKSEKIKETLALMRKLNCVQEPEYLQLSKELAELEPGFDHFQALYSYYMYQQDFSNTLLYTYMEKALAHAETGKQKADVYMTRALVFRNRRDNYAQNNSLARKDYLAAAQADPAKAAECYTEVGNMYLASAGSCQGTDPLSPVHQKAIYVAAYYMFQKAGNEKMMAEAKKMMPTAEEVEKHQGTASSVYLDCWVGEYVKIISQ